MAKKPHFFGVTKTSEPALETYIFEKLRNGKEINKN